MNDVLGPFYFNAMKDPWALSLLIGVLLLLLAEIAARPYGAITVSTGNTLARMRRHGRILLRYTPAALRALGLAFLIVALARPMTGVRANPERVQVRDIAMCVDVSGSMAAQDFVQGSPERRRDRLYVTKLAVLDFIDTRKERAGDRFGEDRVALIPYAAHAWTQCGLTLDYSVFERELINLSIDKSDEKHNRTAIGSAIGLAVRQLSKTDAKSKVIILLTDGINNHGELDPITAANIAKDYGIRTYTIGAGSPRSGLLTNQNNPIDEETLKRIADITGGEYYRATDLESLQGAYREINELETTEVDIGDIYIYDEAFLPWAILGSALMAASILGRRRWFEAIP